MEFLFKGFGRNFTNEKCLNFWYYASWDKISEENKWEIEHHQELVPSELKYFALYVAA